MSMQSHCFYEIHRIVSKEQFIKVFSQNYQTSNFNIQVKKARIQLGIENNHSELLFNKSRLERVNMKKTQKKILKIQEMSLEMKRVLEKLELLRIQKIQHKEKQDVSSVDYQRKVLS